MASLAEDLRAVTGAEAVVTDREVIDAHSRDQASLVAAGRAAVLVRPRTTAQVADVLRVASRHRVPVVTRGAGSGLSGGANAVDGCVVLSVVGMNAITDVDERDGIAVVQPGVITGALKEAAREAGLWYPPDPASAAWCTIGGNVATDAGGLCCAKHGSTRRWVRGLEVVLADGRVIRTGGRVLGTSAGYDLTGLLVGSEGTLGVITEVTVRLVPAPPPAATLVATFADLPAAGQAVASLMAVVTPSLLEIMDAPTIAAVDEFARMDLDLEAAALVIAQSDAPTGDARSAELAIVEKVCHEAGATFVAVSADPDEGELLLNARRLAYPALERKGATLLDDIGVPRSRLAEMLAACERVGHRNGVVVATFGHAGAGILHPTIVFDAYDGDSVARARVAFGEIISTAIEAGGTVTGEHGVGRLKRCYLAHELEPNALELQRAVRRLLDPTGLLNPGVAI